MELKGLRAYWQDAGRIAFATPALWVLVLVIVGLTATQTSIASEQDRAISARQVIQLLFKSLQPGDVDLSGRDLSSMDLSKLDFKSAHMTNANLFGVDLTGAHMSGTNLSGATLDRSVITNTDFSGADMTGVSFMRPTVFFNSSV